MCFCLGWWEARNHSVLDLCSAQLSEKTWPLGALVSAIQPFTFQPPSLPPATRQRRRRTGDRRRCSKCAKLRTSFLPRTWEASSNDASIITASHLIQAVTTPGDFFITLGKSCFTRDAWDLAVTSCIRHFWQAFHDTAGTEVFVSCPSCLAERGRKGS